MIAASKPTQRSLDAKLLVVDANGRIIHSARSAFTTFLRRRDLVIANDAATLPASLHGTHLPTGRPIEMRLAGRRSLDVADSEFSAIIFGEGDYHARTEDRPSPPPMAPGDRLALGPLSAAIIKLLNHPRMVCVGFEGSPEAVWAGLARHGRPIQYAYVPEPLALWDVWTPIAGPPVAFEAPSAGFTLDWQVLAQLRARGVIFATVTHTAGVSSTGDAELDLQLTLDEPYRISEATAAAIRRTRAEGGRIIAVGTTVVRALESACHHRDIEPGEGLATGRIGPTTRLQIVDAILSGTHESGSTHYQLLRAFADDATLARVTSELDSHGYRTHEFGDSVLLQHMKRGPELPG